MKGDGWEAGRSHTDSCLVVIVSEICAHGAQTEFLLLKSHFKGTENCVPGCGLEIGPRSKSCFLNKQTRLCPISYHKGKSGSEVRDGPPKPARQIFFFKGTKVTISFLVKKYFSPHILKQLIEI